MMIFDLHTHNFAGITNEVVSEAKRNGIGRIALLGDVLRHGDSPTPEEIVRINDDTLRDVRHHAPYACGFCFLNPAHPESFVRAELIRCLALPEFRGVKLEISVNCRSLRMNPIMELLAKFDRPLLQHCWYKSIDRYPGESDPSDVAELARRFPQVNIVMAHLGGCGMRGVENVADYPNVWIDTSGGQPEDGFLQYAVRRIGARRIIYGSDAPCRNFGTQLARVRGAGLDAEALTWILGRSARELLKW